MQGSKSISLARVYRLFAGTNLLATVARQVEYENREKRYTHTGYYQINRVEQGLSSHRDVERDVEIGLVAARVEFFVSEIKRKRRNEKIVNGIDIRPYDDLSPYCTGLFYFSAK